ncbi:MAG: DJ-1/PfpI family protein [Sedimentisphaerales bacterium]|nr:DJ-1/PfpI family protein [Sedimentisphaerales bacterium]
MKRIIILVGIVSMVLSFSFAQRRNDKTQKVIQLPKPDTRGSINVEQALAQRRSIREFLNKDLTYTQLGQLAWAGQGITERQSGKRTAPSAGAIYPMTLYFATKEGLFTYNPQNHALEQLESGDLRLQLSEAAMGQSSVAQVACDIIIAGSVNQVGKKYGRKARDFTLLEAGHIAQNIHLQAVALKLGSVPVGAFQENNVRRTCRMSRELEVFYIIPIGYPAEAQATKIQVQDDEKIVSSDVLKKALLIIASDRFRDEELFETQKVLSGSGIETTIASSKLGTITGMLGGTTKAEYLLSQINVDDYDAVIFVGGIGAREYSENETALSIAQQAVQKDKILAAICIAPSILAKAGLLEGKRVTSYPSEKTRLLRAKAQYTGADVEQDGNIITASGPRAAEKFGKTIVSALESR